MMIASYDYQLVMLSIVVSILAAYAARHLTDLVRETRSSTWLVWLVGGAVVDGIGTWSMHYTGMLAFILPVPVQYDWPTVLLSLAVSMVGSATALVVVSYGNAQWPQAVAASILLGGVGISGMHYTAMAAMRVPATQHHAPALATLAVMLAMVISFMALSLTILAHKEGHPLRKLGSAFLRGIANPAMHYTAMAGISFTGSNEIPDVSHAISISVLGMISIGVVPVMGLSVALIYRDITERKRSQDALRRSEELFREVWQSSSVIMFMKDRQGRYMDVNVPFSKLTPLPLEQIVGKTDEEIFPPEQAASFRAHDRRVFEENRALEFEEVAEHEDGPHTSMVYKFPLHDAQGQPYAICGIVTDITEQKQADTIRRLLIDRVMAAQEEERQRLARELHDETGQSLTALLVGLRQIDEMPTLEAARKQAEELRQLTAKALEEVRRLALGLHPHVLDDFGLETALEQYADEFVKTYGVTVDVLSDGLTGRRLPHPVETMLYRIAQEALTNIAKHAHATSASIILRGTPSEIHMIVEDDGLGFDVDEALKPTRMAKHLGIHGMRKRATLLNGSLSIESAPGKGTTVYVNIPLAGI
jgi:PAS domain S-box-containing protein